MRTYLFFAASGSDFHNVVHPFDFHELRSRLCFQQEISLREGDLQVMRALYDEYRDLHLGDFSRSGIAKPGNQIRLNARPK